MWHNIPVLQMSGGLQLRKCKNIELEYQFILLIQIELQPQLTIRDSSQIMKTFCIFNVEQRIHLLIVRLTETEATCAVTRVIKLM